MLEEELVDLSFVFREKEKWKYKILWFLVMAALQKLPQLSACMVANEPSSTCKPELVVSDQFPAGLRVLVVDDDVTCLRILEQMLRRCTYHGESSL